MSNKQTFLEALQDRGVSRRTFLKFCTITASSLALTGQKARAFTATLAAQPRPTVIWMSCQQCTGCSESLLRSFNDSNGTGLEGISTLSVENLILNYISLDYHETLQVGAGYQAEKARADAMEAGGYVLIVDGSIPSGDQEFWSCAAGNSNLASLQEAVKGAALVIALGSCAAFGGIPAAHPNPSNARGYGYSPTTIPPIPPLFDPNSPPLVNVSGCPPMAAVITGTIFYFLTYKSLPELDSLRRPRVFYGNPGDPTVHSDCPRLEHWERNEFAYSHGDEGARQGFCLLHLGCRGPSTRNACTRLGWNTDPRDQGRFKNSPTHAGHGCLGCAEPNTAFWDRGKVVNPDGSATFQGFYMPTP